jgi:hypothetical protein
MGTLRIHGVEVAAAARALTAARMASTGSLAWSQSVAGIIHGRHDWHLAERTFARPSEARK